jgi:hypothetical protein
VIVQKVNLQKELTEGPGVPAGRAKFAQSGS